MDLLDTAVSPEVVFQALHWCMANDELPTLRKHLKLHCKNSELTSRKDHWTGLLLDAANRGKMAAMQTILPYVSQSVLSQEHPLHAKGKSVLNKLLCKAVENEDVELCRDLIKRGADVNIHLNGKPLFHVAACLGHQATTEAMLEDGAGVHCEDQRGDGVIHSVLKSHLTDKVPMLKWLISHGADVQQKSSAGRLPIHTAAFTSADVIEILIHEGLDVNSADDVNGDTPLHLACGLCAEDAIFKLIQHGAKFNMHNYQGQTPLTKLLRNSHNAHDFHSRTRSSLAKRLIHVGFRLPSRHGNNGHELVNKHRKIGRDKLFDNYVLLMTSLESVSSLQSICRCVIRETMCSGQNPVKFVEQLSIPHSLKQYLMFRDSDSV